MKTQKYSVRGKLLEGTVLRMKSKKTAYVQVKKTKYIPKYERYLLKRNTYAVHVPDDVEINVGDIVVCGETRKISKTKSMIVISKKNSNGKISDKKKAAGIKKEDLHETN